MIAWRKNDPQFGPQYAETLKVGDVCAVVTDTGELVAAVYNPIWCGFFHTKCVDKNGHYSPTTGRSVEAILWCPIHELNIPMEIKP